MGWSRVGYCCSYTPLALIDAAGFTPFRILPGGPAPEKAGSILHDNLCPHVKRVLDRAIAGDLPALDGVVFVNSCDPMRRLCDAWARVRPHDPVLLLDLPPARGPSDMVLIDGEGRMLASAVVPTGAKNREAIARATGEVLRAAGLRPGDVVATVSTGYGRERVEGRLAAVTEITCHGRGIQALLPGTRLLVDIGGQDSKVVLFGAGGQILDFAMNDKCAAGTGRFLEAMARALQVDIEELSELDRGATGRVTLSSMCTVFAESEVVSLIAEGAELNEIVLGLNRAIVARVQAMVRRVVAGEPSGLPVAMSGGVARNHGVVRALSAALGREVQVPPEPDTVGALGAALIAKERWARGAVTGGG